MALLNIPHSCQSGDADADFPSKSLPKDPGAGIDRGSGGEDVIDDEYV